MEQIAPSEYIPSPSVARQRPAVIHFTEDELALMRQMAADGKGMADIAAAFDLSASTLSRYRDQQDEVYEALEVGRLDALSRGIKPGLNDRLRGGGPLPTDLMSMTQKERQEEALQLYARLGGLIHSMERCRASYGGHLERLKTDPEYARLFAEAEKKRVERLERKACAMAMQNSERMLSKLLDGEAPEKYARRHEVTGAGGGPMGMVVQIVKFGSESQSGALKPV